MSGVGGPRTKVFVRKVETVITTYEMVRTQSSDPACVEKDKRAANVAIIPVKPDKFNVVEVWREATPLETAVYTAGDGIEFPN